MDAKDKRTHFIIEAPKRNNNALNKSKSFSGPIETLKRRFYGKHVEVVL